MIPGNRLSTEPVIGNYILNMGVKYSKVLDYKLGGVALYDPSLGLNYQIWRGRVFEAGSVNSHVVLDGRYSPEVFFFSYPNIIEFNFSFDINMRPVAVFIAKEQRTDGSEDVDYNTYVYWFDASIEGYNTTFLGNTIKTPKLLADNNYPNNDICLFYWYSDNLCVRYLEERYTIEYVLKRNVPYIDVIGVTDKMRIQIEFLKESQICGSI